MKKMNGGSIVRWLGCPRCCYTCAYFPQIAFRLQILSCVDPKYTRPTRSVFNDLSVEQCTALLSCFVFQEKVCQGESMCRVSKIKRALAYHRG